MLQSLWLYRFRWFHASASCQRDLSFDPSQSDCRLFRQEKALGSAERLAEEGLARAGPMAESPDVHGAMQIQTEEFRRFRMNGFEDSRFQPTQKENERAKKRDPKQVAVT